jgi:predicted metal-dependent hydrolase
MKKRWGSCTKAGVITFNTELVKAPTYCIEYVIMHELCHLKHPHHGKEFYDLLTQCTPDWVRRKERLERVVL